MQKHCRPITIKILDPACGSGAFPMGILSKMVEVLEKLGATNESIHELKLHLIEECIYGIDIQTIATQISKLRFFITLVVEQDKIDLSKPEDNYGVLTLPNLETKFVSANTLIGVAKKPSQYNLFEKQEIETTKQALLKVRQEHFYARTAGAKKRLREEDEKLRKQLEHLLESSEIYKPEDALQLSQWDPYDQNTSASFFDMEWMFGIKDGFDVVIGNPPYIDYRKIDEDTKIGIKNFEITGHSRMINLYTYFIEKGIDLLALNGVVSYITPQQYLVLENCRGVRDLLRKFRVLNLTDFARVKVFEASTYTFVSLIQKVESNQPGNYLEFNQMNDLNSPIMNSLIINPLEEPFSTSKYKPLLLKIEDQNNKTLKNYTDVFCASSSTHTKYNSNSKGLYNFIQASDIFEYTYNESGLFISSDGYSKNSYKKKKKII